MFLIHNVLATLSLCINVTSTLSAVFKASVLQCKTFVFRGLSQCVFPAIYVLIGSYSPTIAIWHIEGWRNVKIPCKRMLKWCSFFAFFRIVLIFFVPLHMWKWRVKSEKWRITMRDVKSFHTNCHEWTINWPLGCCGGTKFVNLLIR